MPTYVYRCPFDEATTELQQPIDSIFVPVCPDCSRSMIKKFFPVGAIFKGSGWAGTRKGVKNASTATEDTAKSPAPEKLTEGTTGAA